MEFNIFEIAKEIEFNAKAEAQAVFDYTELLKKVAQSDLSEEDKETINNTIQEIISDELNHSLKLEALFSSLTGILANKD